MPLNPSITTISPSAISPPFSNSLDLDWVQRVHAIEPYVIERWGQLVSTSSDVTWFDFVGGLGLAKMQTQTDLLFALRCAHLDFEKGLAYGRWVHEVNSNLNPTESNFLPRRDREFELINDAISISEAHFDELIIKNASFLEDHVPFSGANASLEQLAKGIRLAPTDFACGMLSSWLIAGLCWRENRDFSQFTINAIERFSAHG